MDSFTQFCLIEWGVNLLTTVEVLIHDKYKSKKFSGDKIYVTVLYTIVQMNVQNCALSDSAMYIMKSEKLIS